MTDKLKPCPCGETPDQLCIMEGDIKWAWVSGSCCGMWSLEFRTNYHPLDSEECMKLAIEGWNSSPRKEMKE